ncbi:unnamed protein product [marine sediment metagenome]|uniref:Uncharacterized protein n=1 Tax=marine sediment metagenome TaxID=412755 RepID=X0WKW4_9ZZZZ
MKHQYKPWSYYISLCINCGTHKSADGIDQPCEDMVEKAKTHDWQEIKVGDEISIGITHFPLLLCKQCGWLASDAREDGFPVGASKTCKQALMEEALR